MKKTVLISALGSPFFPTISDLLKDKYKLILTDSDPIVKRLYPRLHVEIVPSTTDKSFLSYIKKLVQRYQINYYVPMVDEEIAKIVHLGIQLKNLRVIAPNNMRFVDLCLNKYQLMKQLSKNNISTIKTYLARSFNDQLRFPVFVKPVVGRGSRGARRIENKKQLASYFHLEGYKQDQVMIQEYLEGEEYSVSVIVNNLNKLIAVVPKKIIWKQGTTRHAVTKRNEAIVSICKHVVSKLNPRGVFNVQLKIVGQQARIFEINPRCSGTTPLTCKAGINEIDLCISAYNKSHIKFIDSYTEGLYLYRKWENIYYQ